jgi:hypothetical protein
MRREFVPRTISTIQVLNAWIRPAVATKNLAAFLDFPLNTGQKMDEQPVPIALAPIL